jgi:exonuclease VII small subunit
MLRNFEKYGNIERNDKMDETTGENVELTEDKSSTQLQNDFHAASRNWRRQINNLNYQLVNDRNIESLEKGSQALIRLMRELTEAQERLDKILHGVRNGKNNCIRKIRDNESRNQSDTKRSGWGYMRPKEN